MDLERRGYVCNPRQHSLWAALKATYGHNIPVATWLDVEPVRHALPQRVTPCDSVGQVCSERITHVLVRQIPAPERFGSGMWLSVSYKMS